MKKPSCIPMVTPFLLNQSLPWWILLRFPSQCGFYLCLEDTHIDKIGLGFQPLVCHSSFLPQLGSPIIIPSSTIGTLFPFFLSLGNRIITTTFLSEMIQVHLLEGCTSEVTESDVSISFTKEVITFESTLKNRRFYF